MDWTADNRAVSTDADIDPSAIKSGKIAARDDWVKCSATVATTKRSNIRFTLLTQSHDIMQDILTIWPNGIIIGGLVAKERDFLKQGQKIYNRHVISYLPGWESYSQNPTFLSERCICQLKISLLESFEVPAFGLEDVFKSLCSFAYRAIISRIHYTV